MSTKRILALLNSQIDSDEEQIFSIAPFLGAIACGFAIPPARRVPLFPALSLR